MDQKYLETDLDEALQRLEIPINALNRFINKFLDGDLPEKSQKAVTDGSAADFIRHMHTIKGSAANLGLTGLSLFAQEAESAVRRSADAMPEALTALTAVWDALYRRQTERGESLNAL